MRDVRIVVRGGGRGVAAPHAGKARETRGRSEIPGEGEGGAHFQPGSKLALG